VSARATLLALSLTFLATLTACVSSPQKTTDGPEQAFVRLFAADASGDPMAVMECYTPEAVLVPPDAKPIAGSEAIIAHYSKIFEEVTLELSSKAEIGRVSETMAWHIGRTFGSKVDRKTGARTAIDDRYVAILELCEDGLWRVAALSWGPAR
jgi:ketosteroid isomerase-like protein